jgi:hypothetical protein
VLTSRRTTLTRITFAHTALSGQLVEAERHIGLALPTTRRGRLHPFLGNVLQRQGKPEVMEQKYRDVLADAAMPRRSSSRQRAAEPRAPRKAGTRRRSS